MASLNSSKTVILVFIFTVHSFILCSPASAITHVCQDPSFDSAVAISQSQVLLFKNTSVWVVDLLNYQVNLVYSNVSKTESCLRYFSSSKESLFTWNQHDNFVNLKNKICINDDKKLCPLIVERDPMKENGVLFQDMSGGKFLFKLFYKILLKNDYFCAEKNMSNNSLDNCAKDTESDGTTVAMMTRTIFKQEQGNKDIWVGGPRFWAHISYTSGTYDDKISILKVIIQKKVNSVFRNGKKGQAPPVSGNRFNSKNLIDGVRTFAVLPTGELMLFFDEQFCYLSYYNMKCSKRYTSFLLGCADSL